MYLYVCMFIFMFISIISIIYTNKVNKIKLSKKKWLNLLLRFYCLYIVYTHSSSLIFIPISINYFQQTIINTLLKIVNLIII